MSEHKTAVIDIETTGLVPEIVVDGKRPGTTKKMRLPYDTHFMEYPHIVSMAWKIDDNEAVYHILNQEGRKIPSEASDLHGITTEIAEHSTKLFKDIIMDFIIDVENCEIVVGHGLYFDTSIIKANVLRECQNEIFGEKVFEELTEILHKHKRIDTMRSSTKMMRKWPTLSELHMKIYRKGFRAHHAQEDVEACSRCYNWLLKKGIVPTWEELQEKARVSENG